MTVANSLNKIIYAANAATTKIDADALDWMFDLQRNFFANPSANYKISRPLKKILRESREKIAACINAELQEIIFTSGCTENDNWAIKSAVSAHLKERPNIITSTIEHKAILTSCAAMENLGCTVMKLPVDKTGTVNPAYLQKKSLAEIVHAEGNIFP